MKDRIKQVLVVYESGNVKGYSRSAFIARYNIWLKEQLIQRGEIR